MFFGEFEYRVDEKGRIPVPPRFRRDLKDGLVLVAGVEKCLTGYSLPEWNKLAGSVATTGSVTSEKMRRLNRFLFATASSQSLDGQGRIALAAPLKEYAGIKNEVVVAGVNNYLEIWSKELWEAEKAVVHKQAWQIIESSTERR